MSNEPTDSSDGQRPLADPTVLTTQALRHELRGVEREFGQRQETREREQSTLQELIDVRLDGINMLNDARFVSQHREAEIREAHRLELKVDSEKMLSTASIAAEKAVQAALAAAEKARDQQTLASQLATSKAEDAAKEQLKQQGETFSTAINALNAGQGDIKTALGELRAEKRGGQEQVVERRASTTQMILAGAAVGTLLGVILTVLTGLIGV